jgi:ferrochelatase
MNTKASLAQTPSIGVLLSNLGTPDSPSVTDVRRYLKEFLSDRRVVSMPRILWWPVLNFIILNTRPKRSAQAYAKIWTEEGSPLLTISQRQAQALQTAMNLEKQRFHVVLAMRYGQPPIAEGLKELRDKGVQKIIVLPLYPQFSHTTTSSTRDAIESEISKRDEPIAIEFIEHYYAEPKYIDALAGSVREHWSNHGRAQKLVMSFHGIPQDYAEAGDPYPVQCKQTAALLANALELKSDDWVLSFQSRLGPKQWLEPYTNKTLETLAAAGIKKVQILCPGFSADCLETLEEIKIENRDVFIAAGGKDYQYIRCLNAQNAHIEMMATLIRRRL